jgi:hypothetical protein
MDAMGVTDSPKLSSFTMYIVLELYKPLAAFASWFRCSKAYMKFYIIKVRKSWKHTVWTTTSLY